MADGKDEERLFQRVEALNLQLEYDGFFAVTRSVSAESQEDDGEVEEALLEQLGKHLPDVARIAIGKARGARGRDFVGRQVFVPSIQVFGTLKDCSAEGIVEIAYRRRSLKDPEIDVDLVHSGAGDDLLIIVDGEGPGPSSKTSLAWMAQRTHADERFRRLFERAESVGLTPAHDSGFTVVSRRPIAGVEQAVIEKTILELGHQLREVSAHIAARARGERCGNFVGRRVVVPACFNSFGTIESVNSDGNVTVRYRDPHTGSQRSCWVRGDDLLVVPDKRATAEPAADQNSETPTPWQRLMRRLFGS